MRLRVPPFANILREHGLEPAPDRNAKTTWKEFLSRHRDLMVAADFFTMEAWTGKRLTRLLVLFFIDLSSRKVEIAGVAREATGLFDKPGGSKSERCGRRLPGWEAMPDPRFGSVVHR
jgi:hypothetical protein